MTIKRIQTGARMSQAVIHGNVVHTAGQVADGDDVPEQTSKILSKIDALLSEAGTDKSNLISATIWITDMADFASMNAVWDAWVSEGNTPARACVEAKLARDDLKVEIAVIAAIE